MNKSRNAPSELEHQLLSNPVIGAILSRADALNLQSWYLGAGCVAQTIWNLAHGFEPGAHIKDYDLVYFDYGDLSREAEDRNVRKAKAMFADLPAKVDVVNEARVHLWYEVDFGKSLKPYVSAEDAIDTWPTTATSVGVRYRNGLFEVYAPFGLQDLFGLVVRPNKREISRQRYQAKAARWKECWPLLQVETWDQDLELVSDSLSPR